MKERPILFSTPMVRAILAGTKTQTRRVVKAAPPPGAQRVIRPFAGVRLQWAATDPHDMEQGQLVLGDVPRYPYGQPGDRLWVREAWRAVWSSDHEPPRNFDESYRFWYEADTPLQDGYGKLRPSIHMPRCASRITLEVTGVRVERLQDISEADALAEGIERCQDGKFPNYLSPSGYAGNPVASYRTLWESINGTGSWDANPWVWVVEFKRAEGITP